MSHDINVAVNSTALMWGLLLVLLSLLYVYFGDKRRCGCSNFQMNY